MKEKNKKYFFITNIILFVCAIICLIFYDIFGSLWLKGFTSSWFVILGLVNLIYAKKMKTEHFRFLLLIETGLIFGMCADILLGVWFIGGILSFALGHIMYVIAFYTLEKFSKKDVLFILPIAVISMYIVAGTPYIQIDDPLLKKLLLGYAVIIACMLGKAISNVFENKSLSRKLMLIGCTMFWFSDIVLAFDMFGESSRLTWILCSYVYWPAQCILAFSLFHFVNDSNAKY